MIDPITLEVLREGFVSIVREMRVTLVRTAYSSILYEGEDFSCVLMDGHAQIVAMSKGQDHPLHIVPIGWSMRAVREKFGDDIHPGDVFLHNDPYTGGTHLNDVAMIFPLFAPGAGGAGELFVFPVVRAHWGDVGGMSPGSLSGGATEIFQEGVRIPPIRIVDAGRPNDAALDLIFANMRGPRERQGDFQAMIGTCRKAAERIEALGARYGAPTVREAVAELMDRAEARMRRAIGLLPDGTYVYEAHLESGRERLEPLTVRAQVTVAGEAITVDLTGTSPQTAGPTNVGPAMAPTGAFTIVKSFLDPGSDVNSGAFRPLTVITPPGTIVNANPPAPCGGMVEVKYCVETAVMGALAQALGGRVTGDLKGGGNHCYVGGPDPKSGETFIFYEYPAGGTGAYEGGDGNNTVRAWTESDMTTLQPIEAVEQLYPVRIERTALREDSGGPGQWRGGLGLRREVRIRTAGSRLSVLCEKAVLPPFGVCGGASGATNHFWVRRGDRPIEPSPLPGKVSGFPIEHDDVVVMDSSGGGGFGDPLARDLDAVATDLAEGYVTPAAAEAIYGVVIVAGAIDAEASARRRAELRAERPRVRLAAVPDLDTARGRSVRLDADTAARLGVGAGAVVELVNPGGAPLRAWVARVLPGNGHIAEVPPVALRMLALPEGAEVDIRAVHNGALLGTDGQQRSQARLIRFDEQVVPDVSLNDLAPELIDRFRTPQTRDDRNTLLRKLGMAREDDDGELRPSAAAVLLGSAHPERWLRHAFIQAVAYRGEGVPGAGDAPGYQIDAKDLTGPLDVQVADACRFVVRNMRVAASKTIGRRGMPQYDLAAVFEALVNAVAHRDYSMYGSKIRLRMFANRLEIYSPGALANTMTVDSLAFRQASRNETIASLLAKCPVPAEIDGVETPRSTLMDRRGEGVSIILERSERLSGKLPVFELPDESELKLTIFAAAIDAEDHPEAT